MGMSFRDRHLVFEGCQLVFRLFDCGGLRLASDAERCQCQFGSTYDDVLFDRHCLLLSLGSMPPILSDCMLQQITKVIQINTTFIIVSKKSILYKIDKMHIINNSTINILVSFIIEFLITIYYIKYKISY